MRSSADRTIGFGGALSTPRKPARYRAADSPAASGAKPIAARRCADAAAKPAINERIEHESRGTRPSAETRHVRRRSPLRRRAGLEHSQLRIRITGENLELRRQWPSDDAVIDRSHDTLLTPIGARRRRKQAHAGDIEIDLAGIGRVVEGDAADEATIHDQTGERATERRRDEDLIDRRVVAECGVTTTVPLPPRFAVPVTTVLELLPAPCAICTA